VPWIVAVPTARRTPNAACEVRGQRSGCPGFVRISDIWPRSGHGSDSAERDLAEFGAARRLLFAPAWPRRAFDPEQCRLHPVSIATAITDENRGSGCGGAGDPRLTRPPR
jgi:hypothetical protein